jgi:parallel beta-helix repeat protein
MTGISFNNTIINNKFENNGNSGISLALSTNDTIAENYIGNNDIWGLRIDFSENTILSDNICFNNYVGFLIYRSSEMTVKNNTCENNRNDGIWLGYSNSCVIVYNLLQSNIQYGINIYNDSYNNLVHHNTFIDNNVDGNSQASDNGKKNKWYDPIEKEGNYWSNLGTDCKYKIDGSANSKDLYPINRDSECPNPIMITSITIALPILGSIIFLSVFSVYLFKRRRSKSI